MQESLQEKNSSGIFERLVSEILADVRWQLLANILLVILVEMPSGVLAEILL